MSLITRCPACGTMFKVVPDQLRISEGWVRCGHCADVFDASAHLHADDDAAQPESAAPAVAAAKPMSSVAEPPDDSQGFDSSLVTEIDEAPLSQGPDSALLDEEARALLEHPLDRPFELRRQDDGEVGAIPAEPPPRRFVPVNPPAAPEIEPEPELHDLSFVRQARSKAFWQGAPIRAALALAGVALAIVLVLQVAVHDRDRMAAADPALRPWLAKLCKALDCTVRPPRQIDAIAIDSSSFSKLRGDAFRLNVTLKNQAAMELAMPALELTLTDGQDQPVVRRVLLPAELGAHAGVIAATSEWSGSLALAVAANGTATRISGYRLLAFYP